MKDERKAEEEKTNAIGDRPSTEEEVMMVTIKEEDFSLDFETGKRWTQNSYFFDTSE